MSRILPQPETEPRASAFPPKVSILIVNYNGSRWLNGCLDSLRALTFKNYEVVVVDNASTDDSLQLLKRYPEVKVYRAERNLGFAGGNNHGLPHCHGQYVLLLNNDTVAHDDFLTPLCKYLDDFPQVAVVQGKMVLSRFGGCLDVCGSFLTALGVPYHFGFYKPDGEFYRRCYPVFSGKGACLLFRRDVIAEVGGFLFDDRFFCYYEESDFCHRVWLAGKEVHFVSTPPIEHYMGATSGEGQSAFVLRYFLSNLVFSLSANLSLISVFRILPLCLFVLCASMLVCLVRGKWAEARAHAVALVGPICQFRQIVARRKVIRQIRRRSDGELFSRVLRNPSFDYYWKTAQGKLALYRDKF